MNRIRLHLLPLALCLLGVLAGWSDSAAAQEARAFTNKEGKQIEAVLIGVEGKAAEIRRVADGAVFKIQIGSLSFEDQVWISEWVKKKGKKVAPGAWGKLLVELPSSLDHIDVLGMESTIASTRMSGTTYELNIPEGAWVKLGVNTDDDSGDVLEHLIRYNGGNRWKVTIEGQLLVLARDGGEPKIYGITLPNDYSLGSDGAAKEHERFLRRVDKERLAESVCVDLPSNFEIEALETLRTPVVAVTSSSVQRFDSLARLSGLAPKAIDLVLYEDAISALANFDSLEAMAIRSFRSTTAGDPNEPPDPNDPVDPIELPQVRDLSLSSLRFSPELAEALSKMNELRLFELSQAGGPSSTVTTSSGTRIIRTSSGGGKWERIDALQSLESLHLASSVSLKAAEVAKLSKLKSLRFGPGVFSSSDPDLSKLANHKGLRQLSVTTTSFPAEVLDSWAASGGMSEVTKLKTYQSFNYGALTKLEILSLYGSTRSSIRFDLTQLANLPNLRYFQISGAGQRDMDSLAALPAKEKVEVVRFYYGSFHDLKPLAGFTNLKRLDLTSHSGSLYEMDVSVFPKLESIYLISSGELDTLKGIPGHPSLQYVRLSSCGRLKDLGEAAPNKTLRTLYLSRCSQLTDLSAFDRTTGLKQLRIYDCDKLSEPLRLEQNNELGYISVSSCENLKDRRPGD